jgi:hypothetical protein
MSSEISLCSIVDNIRGFDGRRPGQDGLRWVAQRASAHCPLRRSRSEWSHVSLAPSPRSPASEPPTPRGARPLSGDGEHRWRGAGSSGPRLAVRWGVSGRGGIFEGGEEKQSFTKNRIRAIHFSLAESASARVRARRGQRERTGKLASRRFSHNPKRELKTGRLFFIFFLRNPLKSPDSEK